MKLSLKHRGNSFHSISAVDSRVMRVFLRIVCHIREWLLRAIKKIIQRNMGGEVRVWEALTYRPLSRCERIDGWLDKWTRWGVAWNGKNNRPFPNCFLSLLQHESPCETIHMKMCSADTFFLMQVSETHFHLKSFGRLLVLKQRHKVTPARFSPDLTAGDRYKMPEVEWQIIVSGHQENQSDRFATVFALLDK